MYSSAPLSPDFAKAFEREFNLEVVTVWGMTETGMIGCTREKGDDRIFLNSGWEGTVREEEMWLRGPMLLKGYRNRPEANKEAFDGEWMRTGDGVSVDKDGGIILGDRIKEVGRITLHYNLLIESF
jgi:long-subunit acyl-CoA synthetase (AMP-forming)